jgi:hypothetical protein
MKILVVLVAVTASLATLVSTGVTAPAGSARPAVGCKLVSLPRVARASEQSLFGHIASLTRRGPRYILRFDPAWHLTGMTANTAAAQDGAVQPGEPVPNDNYTVDESHRLLRFFVPGRAPATVLTRGTCSTPTSIARLARSKQRAGFWIAVRGDTVRSVDQQYQP